MGSSNNQYIPYISSELPYQNVFGITIDVLSTTKDVCGDVVDVVSVIVDFSCPFIYSLLYRNLAGCSLKVTEGPIIQYLVIHDSISQLLDKSYQGFGIINVPQEPNNHVLSGEWFKFCDDILELPGRGMSKLIKCSCKYKPPKFHSPPFFHIIIIT